MQEYLGLPESCLLCPGDEKYGHLVLNEILTAGNFGRKDLRGAVSSSSDTRWRRFLKRLFHLLRFIPLAPLEVLSAPFFKTWQYFWRLKNNYLQPLSQKG